ncbi:MULTISPECIES: hypothetical protein [Clostridium]|uniref:Uncharacterized protein n=1 Tax=Clostridium ragsdalei P11 TaxID=1353534 RepID=A0A1A6AM52_9CLOT|nr:MULTISPECIES: hypothetical protein [Clostridium]OBR91103.1 hypothetical protein CLRAG_32190 [Clostridium ragsdalei P11]QXE20059.1 hypothetical protein B5S50_15165 [Clostridium sp. 001]
MDIIFVTPELNPLEIMEKLQDTFNLFSNWDKNLLELLANNAPLRELGESALPFINNPIAIYTPGLRNIFFCERKKARNLMLYSEEDTNKYLSPEGSVSLEQKDYILAIVNLNATAKTRDELLSVLETFMMKQFGATVMSNTL